MKTLYTKQFNNTGVHSVIYWMMKYGLTPEDTKQRFAHVEHIDEIVDIMNEEISKM